MFKFGVWQLKMGERKMISFSRFKHIFTSVIKVRKCKGGQLFYVDFHFKSLEYQSALVLWDKVIVGFKNYWRRFWQVYQWNEMTFFRINTSNMNMIIWKVKNQIVKRIYDQLIVQQRHLLNFNWEAWYIVESFFQRL
jgi:hypothetical protein